MDFDGTDKVMMDALSLRDAFLIALHRLETLEDVPAETRLGWPLPIDDVRDLPPREAIATGPNYIGKYRLKPQPVRLSPEGDGNGMPQQPVRLPRIPDAKQLECLLCDHGSARSSTTAEEQRICRAHEWVLSMLKSGTVQTEADRWIIDDNTKQKLPLERSPILEEFWEHCYIDYRANLAVSRGEDWSATYRGFPCSGSLRLSNIEIDAILFQEVIYRREALVAGLIWDEQSQQWRLSWRDACVSVGNPSDETIVRGLKAIALLMRHPGMPVSEFLLNSLSRKSGHPRKPSAAEGARRDDWLRGIDPISERLFAGQISVKRAHTELLELLVKSPSIVFKTHAEAEEWLKSAITYVLRPSKGVQRPLFKSDDLDRAKQNGKKSLDNAHRHILEHGKESGTLFKKHLDNQIIRKLGFCLYKTQL